MRRIVEETDARHELEVLKASDELCLARLHARNARATHAFSVTEERVRAFSWHFSEPSAKEGFNIVRHQVNG